MDVSMDIHGKSVNMNGKFHIHGKPWVGAFAKKTNPPQAKTSNSSTTFSGFKSGPEAYVW